MACLCCLTNGIGRNPFCFSLRRRLRAAPVTKQKVWFACGWQAWNTLDLDRMLVGCAAITVRSVSKSVLASVSIPCATMISPCTEGGQDISNTMRPPTTRTALLAGSSMTPGMTANMPLLCVQSSPKPPSTIVVLPIIARV